ncbi:hypothetical protein [Pseudomonas sp. TH10]|uniref:hypothetical protein n=1 Tax=Pseudomonas sp. TH10 TaxID=2796376 RepID=UPI001F5B4054|nr:hypothetical protein [Pseudomonas sp. TH10]
MMLLTGVDHPELDGHDQFVHLWHPMMGCHQLLVLFENAAIDRGEQKGGIVGRSRVFEDSGDFYIADHA